MLNGYYILVIEVLFDLMANHNFRSEEQENHENIDIAKESEKINDEGLSQIGGITKQPSLETKIEKENVENKEEEIVFRHKEPELKNQKQNNEVDNNKQSTGEAPSKRPSTRRSSSRSLKQPMSKYNIDYNGFLSLKKKFYKYHVF